MKKGVWMFYAHYIRWTQRLLCEAARETEQRKIHIHECLFFSNTKKHKPNTLLLNMQLHVKALKGEKATLAHQTLQTKTMWNSYTWHWAVAPSIVRLHFSPSHLPSGGCSGNGCEDLATSQLPLINIHMKEASGWSRAHSMCSVDADGYFRCRMGRVYVQSQCIFMCLKHICGGRLLWI